MDDQDHENHRRWIIAKSRSLYVNGKKFVIIKEDNYLHPRYDPRLVDLLEKPDVELTPVVNSIHGLFIPKRATSKHPCVITNLVQLTDSIQQGNGYLQKRREKYIDNKQSITSGILDDILKRFRQMDCLVQGTCDSSLDEFLQLDVTESNANTQRICNEVYN